MPKLDKTKAKAVDDVEPNTFEAYPEGIYLGTLKTVESKEGPNGEYWSWVFGDNIGVEDEKKYPGSLWVNTSLSEASEWKMKEVFDAFGVPANTDTDTLLGTQVWLVVSQRTIEKGSRMGEIGNNVERVIAIGGGEE